MSVIKVITSYGIDIKTKNRIEEVFKKKHSGKDISFSYEIDPSILGGILVIDNGVYYDGTLKSRFIQLQDKDALKKTKIISAGSVIYNGDGIIKISGLNSVKYNELLRLENGVEAIALNLEKDEVGAVVLGDETKIAIGMTVYSTGQIVSVPVGSCVLGRVINPLGHALDGLPELETDFYRPIEAPAPSITQRDKVTTPLQTGILAIDSMIPIGKGQRELIIGDRQTGKTSIAIDTIINQKGKDIYCVYVSIGQKASTISNLVRILKEREALEYTCVVCSTAYDSAPLQYIAPYCGCAIAEEFMYNGKDVLIVYDDLSKHAIAYRTMSLLLKRPPGREAYPGDIFYLHSRLLERAAKLNAEMGGGSMTALPIVETLAGDISAYIPTNVISITDGQIYLEDELFNAGIRPAINVGLSVSRVGANAQIPAMKKVSGKLRLELSQYRELAIFAQFGSELDASTRHILSQGEKTTETLKQPQYNPYSVEEQVILLYAVNKEFLKDIPVKQVREFNKGLLNYIKTFHPNIIDDISQTSDLTRENMERIEKAIIEYKEYIFISDNYEKLD
ncbi:MAG: F0F1 ATP synthase subunit alpha [Clostridiales bacterium]|nr:F0F1 ATP synthase subunit alpha [Clostridiales bacterium]